MSTLQARPCAAVPLRSVRIGHARQAAKPLVLGARRGGRFITRAKLQYWKNGRLVSEEVDDEPSGGGSVAAVEDPDEDDEEVEIEDEVIDVPVPEVAKAKAEPKAKEAPKQEAPKKATAKRAPAPPAAPAPAMSTMLQIFKADFTVNSIVDKINRGKLDLRPSYQREYVWTMRIASRLIESILLNVPIPTMFFHETANGVLEVVDGKQRLTSIWSYMEEKFPDGTEFRLQGLEVYDEINNKTFSDLTEQQQETIKDYALNVHTISRHCEPDFVFEVFERLNMGATQLNEQELRNCIYQGPYTDLLGDLATNEHLLKIYKSNTPHIRMKDRELILRFFAMQATGPGGFYLPVKGWLNNEIRDNMDLDERREMEMQGVFESAVELSWEVFGEGAFRTLSKSKGELSFDNGEVNVALFDTVMYAFTQVDREAVLDNKEAVLKAFVEMLGEQGYRRKLLSQPKAVVTRHEEWLPRLLEAIGH